MATSPQALLIGRAGPTTGELAGALDATEVAPPLVSTSGSAALGWDWGPTIDAWADELAQGEPLDRLAVCTWPSAPGSSRSGDLPLDLIDLDPDDWMTEVEVELATWSRAVVAATQRCAPGGSVVVVVERPSPLEAAGQTATLAVAEGLAAFARSAALVHGARGVRVNVVGTALWSAPEVVLGTAPALDSFPGTVAHEVAGAVRALWSEDTCGVTGTVVRADSGRSW